MARRYAKLLYRTEEGRIRVRIEVRVRVMFRVRVRAEVRAKVRPNAALMRMMYVLI